MTPIWKNTLSKDDLNSINQNTLASTLNIQVEEIGDDFIKATMPVDSRTKQPFGILHGGASVVLAETLGSIASMLCLPDTTSGVPVGLEINANHLRPVSSGKVTGIARPVKMGKTVHVWNIEIYNEDGKLTCISRLTILITQNVSKVE